MPEFAPKRPDQLETTFVQPTGYWVPISPDGGPTGKTNISDMVRSMDKADTFSLSAGDNNNLAIGDNKFIILNNSTGGQVTLTGMASAGVYSYKVLYVINNGPDPVLLSCGNAGSSSANRFAASDDFVLAKDDSATLIYTTKFMIVGVGTQQATPTTTTSTTTTLIPMQGLKLWLDAQDNASYPGSGNTWTDISGQGNDFNVSGDAFVASEPKHFNFMGGEWGSSKPSGAVGPDANATVIVVSQIDPSTADFRVQLAAPFDSDYQALTLNDNNLGFFDNGTASFIDSGIDTTDLPGSADSFHFWIYKLSQSSPYWDLMYDGTTSLATITNANASFVNGIGNIGAINISGAYYAQFGKVALALYWDRHLTNGEIDTVLNYFGGRYTTTSTSSTTEEPTTSTSTSSSSSSSTTEEPTTTTSSSSTTAGAFSPSDITGLQQWYDFSDSANVKQNDDGTGAVSNGDPIGFVDDLSAVGNNSIQATAANKPTWNTNVQNGLAAAVCDSTDSLANPSLVTGLANFTIAWTGRLTNTSVAQFMDYRNKVDPNGVCDLLVAKPDAGPMYYGYRGPNCVLELLSHTGDTNWHYYVMRYDGTTFQAWIDGASVGTASSSSVSTLDYYVLGGGNVEIGEICAYNVAVTSGERGDLQTYLDNKWGISAGTTSTTTT